MSSGGGGGGGGGGGDGFGFGGGLGSSAQEESQVKLCAALFPPGSNPLIEIELLYKRNGSWMIQKIKMHLLSTSSWKHIVPSAPRSNHTGYCQSQLNSNSNTFSLSPRIQCTNHRICQNSLFHRVLLSEYHSHLHQSRL